jgi:uncharacterized protein (TIGR00730 family)
MTFKNICVFCGAREGVAEEYKVAASRCGVLIAQHKLNLVYGAGQSGLMGIVSNAAFSNGAEVIGVFPKAMKGKEPLNEQLTKLYVVDSMSERKDIMIREGEAFLILPGGVGTVDEAFEVITLNTNGFLDNKPLIFININGFWDAAELMLKKMADTGFTRPNLYDSLFFVNSVEEAFEKLGYKA